MYTWILSVFVFFYRALFLNARIIILAVLLSIFSETVRFIFVAFLELFWELFFWFLYFVALSLYSFFLNYVDFVFDKFDYFLAQVSNYPFLQRAIEFIRLREFLSVAIVLIAYKKFFKWLIVKPVILKLPK